MKTKAGLLIALALLLARGVTAEDWFKLIEVTTEATAEDRMDYTVRFTPAKNHQCDQIVFECVYHQEFPWENVRGKKYTKIHEPVNFVYRRMDVKMVDDLDQYVSFRAPYGIKALMAKYGPMLFNKDYPVTIERIMLTGFGGDTPLWSYTVPIGVKLDSAALAKQPSAAVEEAIPAAE